MLLLGEVSREVSREDEMREIIKERLGIWRCDDCLIFVVNKASSVVFATG